MEEFQDKLRVDGVNSMGYGIVPKLVLKDKRLTPTAKLIYAYFCSYAGAGTQAFPSVKLIISDLQLSRNTYYKHFSILKEFGYIKTEQTKDDRNKWSRTIYTLIQNPVPCTKNCDTEIPCTKFRDTQFRDTESSATNINSLSKLTVFNIISQSEYEELTDGQEQNFINIVNIVLETAQKSDLKGVTPQTITDFFDYWQKIPKGKIHNMENYMKETICSYFKYRL